MIIKIIEKFDDTKKIIDTDVKLPDIILKNVVILMTSAIKDDKFYPQILLEAFLVA